MSTSDSPEFSSLAQPAILQTLQNWFQSETPVSRGLSSVGDRQSDVELFWIDATTMEYPFQTLFSVGLSDRPLTLAHGDSVFGRVELIMHLPLSWPAKGKRLQLPEYQWPEEWLRTLICSIAEGSILLSGPQVIISNDEPQFLLAQARNKHAYSSSLTSTNASPSRSVRQRRFTSSTSCRSTPKNATARESMECRHYLRRWQPRGSNH